MVKEVLAKKWEVGAVHYAKGSSAVNEALWRKIIQEIIGADLQQEVLDVGTGPGFLAIIAAELGHRSTGLDLSQSMLAIAKEKAADRKLACQFVQGDAESLPFKSDRFDFVMNRLNLWTLPNPGKGIHEWVRVLKPQGKLAVFVNDIKNPFEQTKELKDHDTQNIFTKEYFEAFQHLPFARALPSQVKALFEAAGLRDVTIQPIKDKRTYTPEHVRGFLQTNKIQEHEIDRILNTIDDEESVKEILRKLNLGETVWKRNEDNSEFVFIRHMAGVVGTKE
ncbi:methyltransferase domain-containing protein [Rossellomorea vietnamensis]|uniref:Methyltransferase domain-containing protein n=2 Tax=Rossellomorea TaxID=2837508 RepID=A0A5D4KC66_9BACI|nr:MULTISPECIES: class I SAM-dependent methyltransferase [Rossellomorea]TYR74340.1 methyltransferase domain-containing protein [Rossellomorea vietnamensis]TYS77053.1 methyltransferase domain-containing protein [Rossellomorea aquimaris]